MFALRSTFSHYSSRFSRPILRRSPNLIAASNRVPPTVTPKFSRRHIPHQFPHLNSSPLIHSLPSDWNVANILTFSRICVTPPTAYSIVVGDYNWALAGLLYAASSDALDGAVARRLHISTKLGSMLDPAADKLLITSSVLSLAYQDIIPKWLACVVVGRDVALVGGWAFTYSGEMRRLNATGSVTMQPLFLSKVNTAAQIVLVFVGVLKAGEYEAITESFFHGWGIVTAITTVSSGTLYASRFLRHRRQRIKQRWETF